MEVQPRRSSVLTAEMVALPVLGYQHHEEAYVNVVRSSKLQQLVPALPEQIMSKGHARLIRLTEDEE